jgi:uncharacterized iron-regulated membrane protein
MKKSVLKIVALLLGVALVASTYAWWECRKKDEELMRDMYYDTLSS